VNFASDLARDTAPGSNVPGANAAAMNALGQFDNALQTQKDYGPAMLGRACLLLQLQRYQEAVTAFRNVLQVHLFFHFILELKLFD
jgi:predicted RNA polymerase sigma factor